MLHWKNKGINPSRLMIGAVDPVYHVKLLIEPTAARYFGKLLSFPLFVMFLLENWLLMSIIFFAQKLVRACNWAENCDDAV